MVLKLYFKDNNTLELVGNPPKHVFVFNVFTGMNVTMRCIPLDVRYD